MVTRPRGGLYVWVTWLSKLMAGEVRCHWAPWFRTHYTDYLRAPSDFQMAAWTAEHTQMLDQLVKEREGRGEGVFKEDQNRFRVRRPSGLTIAGRPDLIAVDEEGLATIYDAKTGEPRQSDIIQVMLYMMCLPYGSPLYKGKAIQDSLVPYDCLAGTEKEFWLGPWDSRINARIPPKRGTTLRPLRSPSMFRKGPAC